MPKLYRGSDNIARRTKKAYFGVSDVARACKKVYIGDSNNKARLTYMRMPITIRIHGAPSDSVYFYYDNRKHEIQFGTGQTYKDYTFDFLAPQDTIYINSYKTEIQVENVITYASGIVDAYARPQSAIYWYGAVLGSETGSYMHFARSKTVYEQGGAWATIDADNIFMGLSEWQYAPYYTQNRSICLQYIGNIPNGFKGKILADQSYRSDGALLLMEAGGYSLLADGYYDPEFVALPGAYSFYNAVAKQTQTVSPSDTSFSTYPTFEMLQTSGVPYSPTQYLQIRGIY